MCPWALNFGAGDRACSEGWGPLPQSIDCDIRLNWYGKPINFHVYQSQSRHGLETWRTSNELPFYVELASPCTNLHRLKFCLVINISIVRLNASAKQRYLTISSLYQKFIVFTVHKSL